MKFQPPYLRYEIPADLLEINARIAALIKKSRSRRTLSEQITPVGSSIAAIEGGLVPESDLAIADPLPTRRQVVRATKIAAAPVLTRATDAALSSSMKPNPVSEANPSSKVGASMVTVSPSGAQSMGFNCRLALRATNNFSSQDVVWELRFKDPATGVFNYFGQLIGTSSAPASTDVIDFDIDYSAYYLAAYTSPDNKATFKVFCQGYDFGLPGPAALSDAVVLDFSAPACIGLHSVSLSEDTFVGGENDKAPTMTVAIDAPAPPGGQRVNLSVSNSNLGNIHGSKFFMIEEGQTTGAISWFLGTRKVYSKRSFNIVVGVNATVGYAGIKLTRK